jgi:hypothetical protein
MTSPPLGWLVELSGPDSAPVKSGLGKWNGVFDIRGRPARPDDFVAQIAVIDTAAGQHPTVPIAPVAGTACRCGSEQVSDKQASISSAGPLHAGSTAPLIQFHRV